MSKIKIFSLGGLDENGKNCYVIDIDNDIFVFDCGLKYANESLFGIDYIIPNFDYLISNKDRIKGVFLTHGHYENMGAVYDLVNEIPEIKIYCTKFTKYVLETENIPEQNIIEIQAHKKINFDSVSIFPISVSHSAPDSVMYIINTADGAIAYTGDFIIDPTMMGSYNSDIGKIAYVGKQGVLALMSESVFSEEKGFTSPKHRLSDYFKDVINRHDKRIIFLVLPNHLYTIQDIFTGLENSHRKVVIMGKSLQNIISLALKEGYLSFNENILGDLSDIEDEKVILLIGEDKEKPYNSVEKIIGGYDKFIKLKPTDQFVFAVSRSDSNEKRFVKIQNDLASLGVQDITIPKDKTALQHASKEDLMLMIKLMNPKYYIPVKGDYRYMVGNANLASVLGINNENILLKQNGDVITFQDGILVQKEEHIKVTDVLIDGKSSDDVGELVVKDREMLSESGIVLISATLSKKGKKLLVGPEVTTRGFIYIKDSTEMIEKIKEISLNVIERNSTPSYVDYNKIKVEIREELGKYLYEETECKPMIIAVIQEL